MVALSPELTGNLPTRDERGAQAGRCEIAAAPAPVCQFVECPLEPVALQVESHISAFRPGFLLAARESGVQQTRPISGSTGGICRDDIGRLENRLSETDMRKLTLVQCGQNTAHQNHQDAHADGGAAGANERQDRDDR